MNHIVGIVLIYCGVFFVIVAAVGIVRLPDFYSRLHASGKAETLGVILSFVGLAVYNGFHHVSFKILLIVALILLANPVGTHIISRAAWHYGLKPKEKKEK